jgi:glycerophosphoryl diester phosphodiesterase
MDARNLLFFPWRVKIYRRHCSELYVWNVNSIGTMRHFIKSGIDGIITDFPDRLARVLRK